MRKINLALPALVFLFLFQEVYAQSTQPQNILFIFDASGSMWGKLDKSTKIQVAKETMGKLTEKIKAEDKVGLIVYGHRNASDCNDIETMLPISKMDKAGFTAKINALNPKGKTPIAKSINQALAIMRGINDPVTVILVTDGLETCEGNACEIVKNAKTAGVKITMHVVGFGIAEKDLAPLECIAQAGGGQYFPANNAEELANAMEQTVKEVPAGDAWVSVQTTLEGKLVDAMVKVYKKDDPKNEIGGRTYAAKETNPRVLQVPSGTYEIEVIPVRIEGHPGMKFSDVVVAKGDTVRKEIEFEQGIVEMLVTRNGALSDATIQIFPTGTNKAIASTRSYTQASHNPAKLKIPPGVYDIVLKSVEISGGPIIKIEKKQLGSAGNLNFSHDFKSGELSVGAKNAQGLVDATVNIFSTETNKNVGAGRTYQSTSSNPRKFTLEPGTYRVEIVSVKPPGLGKKTITVEITANGSVERIIEW